MVSVEEVFLALQEMSAQEVRKVVAGLNKKFPALAPPPVLAPIQITQENAVAASGSVNVVLIGIADARWTAIADTIIALTGKEQGEVDPLVRAVLLNEEPNIVAINLTVSEADRMVAKIRKLGGKAGKL